MANAVTDPKVNPKVVIPDFSKPDPLLTFKLEDVAFVYGTKWKQRYFKKVGNDYFPLPAQWDVNHQLWRAYMVQPNTDWWVPFYPADNNQRPTGPLCDGCHSVNYNIQTKTVTEWNVGCERCHGPGSAHAANPTRQNIVNPAKLDFVRANDTCIQCHSQGQPLKNPIEGRYYDWPVGFHQGLNLQDFWKLEEHKLGETNFMHFADGHRAQKPDAGQRFRPERYVPTRRDLLQLPRCAWDIQQRGFDQARRPTLSDVPQPGIAERTTRAEHRSAHASQGRQCRK
jgi:hypothetical protein